MPDPLVVQVMRAFRVDLLNSEREQMALMARRWKGVEDGLQERVTEFAERVQRDNLTVAQVASRQFQLERYGSLLAQTQGQMERYAAFAETSINKRKKKLAKDGVIHAAAATKAVLTDARVRASFNILPADAIENIVALTSRGPSRALIDTSFGAGAQGMFDQLVRGVAEGVNPRKMARDMLRLGLSQSLNQVMRIARTEPMRAYRAASRSQYEASGVVAQYRRLATRSARTCMACLLADGEVYDVTEPFREHPQGRCTSVPVVDGLKPVEWEKGKDWFTKQPEAAQRKMLGPGKFNGWKDGRFALDEIIAVREDPTWGESLQVKSLRDLLAGTGRTFFMQQLQAGNE